MSRPDTLIYKALNWPAYNKALKRRGSLTIWFDPDLAWAAKPSGKRGRQPVYSDAAVQTCLTMKVLLGMALRQTTGFVESLLFLIGLDWEVPDFSTLSRRQKALAVTRKTIAAPWVASLFTGTKRIVGRCAASQIASASAASFFCRFTKGLT